MKPSELLLLLSLGSLVCLSELAEDKTRFPSNEIVPWLPSVDATYLNLT